jgi:hypothetical protein
MRSEVDEKNLEVWQWKKMHDDLDKVRATVTVTVTVTVIPRFNHASFNCPFMRATL